MEINFQTITSIFAIFKLYQKEKQFKEKSASLAKRERQAKINSCGVFLWATRCCIKRI